MRPGRNSLEIACLALVAAALLAGCGSSGGSEGEDVTASTGNAGTVDWPLFGRVPERTHYLPAEKGLLDPPLRRAWQVNTHALIEFPPAIADGVAYVINKYGNAKAVRLRDRKVLWEVTNRASDNGVPNFVTAPVYYEGRIYGAFLGGELVAGDAKDGHTLWRRKLRGHLESSPMAAEGALYLGTDTTDVVALDADDGAPRWRTNLPAAIKASPSLHDGRLYVADYQSSMFALDAKTGKPLWRTNTSKQPPYGRGGFFSSPRDRLRQRLRRPRRRHRLRPRRKERQGRLVLRHRRPGLRLPRPGRGSRHPRRPSTSGPKTGASTRSTPPPASRAGTTTSAARSPAPPP